MLFDPRAKGKVALVDEPAIGLFDAALAAEAMGALRFENICNMSPAEIAALFKFLGAKREEGFFRRCWSTGPGSGGTVSARRSGDAKHVVAGL